MKPSKHVMSTSSTWASVPQLVYQRGLLKSPLSHRLKERRNRKPACDKVEPMVLRSPPAGESLLRYALPIPSSKTQALPGKDEKIKMITKRLGMLVSSLEETFGLNTQEGEEEIAIEPQQEEVEENMKSFLMCCSHLAAQLESAVKQEHNVLRSLSKWFHGQVNQAYEELEPGQEFLNQDPTLIELAAANQPVTPSTAQILQNEEEPRRHSWQESLPIMNSENSPVVVKSYETVKHQIEDAAYSMTNKLDKMLEIFEKQSNIWKRTMKERGVLEAKYKQIQSDLESLSQEKRVLENKLRRLKDPEKAKIYDTSTKKIVKPEKKKDKGKMEEAEWKTGSTKQLKMKEDFQNVQKLADDLESENRILWEKLKVALEEAERAKHELDNFLNQQKAKAGLERGKIKMKGEDSIEKRGGKLMLGRRSSDDILRHPEITAGEFRRSIEESSEKERADSTLSNLSQYLGSEGYNLWEMPLETAAARHAAQSPSRGSRESQGLLVTEALPPGSARAKLSFTEPTAPGTGDAQVEISEEELRKKGKKDSQGKDVLDKQSSASESQARKVKQRIVKGDRRKAFLINPTSPEDMILLARRESETESVYETIGEELGENSVSEQSEYQDAKPEGKVKKKRISKGERLSTHYEELNENTMGRHQESMSKSRLREQNDSVSRGEHVTAHSKKTEENLKDQPEDSVSKTQKGVKKQRKSKEGKPIYSNEEPYENLVLQPQHSTSKSEIQAKTQRTSTGEVFTISGENLVVEHQDADLQLEIHAEEQSTFTDERSIPLEAQEKDISLEDVLREENAELPRRESQVKTPEPVKKESLEVQTVEEKSDGDIKPEDEFAVLESPPQVTKAESLEINKILSSQRVVQEADQHLLPSESKSKDHTQMSEARSAQLKIRDHDMNKLPEEGFILKGVETGYKVQIKTSDSKQPRILTTKHETIPEPPNKVKSLPASGTSIDDLILHLGLDKVIETDPEQLRNLVARPLLKSELKTQPKLLPETETEHMNDIIQKHIIKGENQARRKSHTETTAEHVTKYFGKGIRKGPLRTQFKSHKEIETEPIANVVGRGVIKGPIKLQFKSYPETDTEPLTDVIGKSVIKESIKTQLKSHPGVNLLRNRDALTQEDSSIKPIAPMKSTKSSVDHKVQNVDKSNIDDLEESKSGTNLFKYKNSSIEYRDSIVSRRITPSKFPMNVINLSPFVNQAQSRNANLKQKAVGFTDVLPAVISVSKKPISREALWVLKNSREEYHHYIPPDGSPRHIHTSKNEGILNNIKNMNKSMDTALNISYVKVS